MIYYLDTNILVYSLFEKDGNGKITSDVTNILEDYTNLFRTSSICVKEVLHLYKSKNIVFKKSSFKNAQEILFAIKEANIEMVSFNEKHLLTYANLDIYPSNNNDPNDHVIVSQAISDKIPLISSDRDFKNYISQGLDFIFNKR
jgi:PIN domain nuclease of toxin-antitoxin system